MLSLAHLGHIHKTLWDKNFLWDKNSLNQTIFHSQIQFDSGQARIGLPQPDISVAGGGGARGGQRASAGVLSHAASSNYIQQQSPSPETLSLPLSFIFDIQHMILYIWDENQLFPRWLYFETRQ